MYVDAKSVFAAVTATFIKQPAEKSLLCHVQYLRELLDKRVMQHLVWLDTRDMAADGLTKGAVARHALHQIMAGDMHIAREHEEWKSSTKSTGGSQQAETGETNATCFAYLSAAAEADTPGIVCLEQAPAA